MSTSSSVRTALITGATSGLGEAAATALASAGWRVLVVGRDAARGAEVVGRLNTLGGRAEFLSADLFTVAGVQALAAEVRSRCTSLDLLINNAGGTFGTKSLTPDGFERTFALNVMAPWVLTDALITPLAAARGRVVNVVTGVPRGAKASLDELVGDKADAGMGSYVRAKLALIAITREQQRIYGPRGVTAVSLHPGVIPDTRFGQDMPAAMRKVGGFVARLFGFASTLDQAAARYVRVGTEAVEGGGFYDQGTLREAPTLAQDPTFATGLWQRLDQRAHA